MKSVGLTQERLREVVHYDPQAGVFVWLPRAGNFHKWNARYAGKEAGTPGQRYRHMTVDRTRSYAHRLAWLYMTGNWPAHGVDHIDGDGFNNRWTNLRLANQSQNAANRGPQSNNKTGLKGVSFIKSEGKYQARLTANRKLHLLGRFDNAEDAYAAYVAAAEMYCGDFARTE